MTFLAIVAALSLEQIRALSAANPAYSAYRRFVRFLELKLDAGAFSQGVVAWGFATVPLVVLIWALAAWLHAWAAPLALAFEVAVLYLTMGFRQFSHVFRATHDSLRSGDVDAARISIAPWAEETGASLAYDEIARLAIERGLFSAHRHVFGVIAWFAVFGAAGAVFYRACALLHDAWGMRSSRDATAFGRFSREVFVWIDWVPARLTAVSFAIVGDFEDALYCWRTQAAGWSEPTAGIVLASGAGALGVRLGSVIGIGATPSVRPELGTGEDADAELMTSAIGLVWRALVLWLFVILLITVASWLGSAGH